MGLRRLREGRSVRTIPIPCRACGTRTYGDATTCDRCAGAHTVRPTRCEVCSVPSAGRRWCPAHDPETDAGRLWRQPWRSGYSDPQYLENRKAVRIRSGGRCEYPGCGLPGSEVDHRTPLARGGTNELANLRLLCRDHHRRKTALDRRKA
jgi:5-methylcytosine-specific restriction enzyme A